LLDRRLEEHRHRMIAAGTVAAVIANVNRAEGTPAFSPADFVPTYTRPSQDEDEADQEAVVDRMKAVLSDPKKTPK
jgi:hypothetical protein